MTQFNSFSTKLENRDVGGTGFLEIVNLFKSYPTNGGDNFVVLNNINLTVDQDEYIFVIGHRAVVNRHYLKLWLVWEKRLLES